MYRFGGWRCAAVGALVAGWANLLSAQWLDQPHAAAAATAQTFTASRWDAWSAAGNVGALAEADVVTAAVGAQQLYQLPELSRAAFALAVPFRDRQAVGVAATQFGFGGYSEGILGVAYARQVGRWGLGARINSLWVQVPEFGGRQRAWVDVGLRYRASERLALGLRTVNVQQAKLGDELGQRPLPGAVMLGAAYTASPELSLAAELQQRVDVDVLRGQLAVCYRPVPAFRVQLGYASAPSNVGLGVGWQ